MQKSNKSAGDFPMYVDIMLLDDIYIYLNILKITEYLYLQSRDNLTINVNTLKIWKLILYILLTLIKQKMDILNSDEN